MKYLGILFVTAAISACSPQGAKTNDNSGAGVTAAAADEARKQISDALNDSVAGWKAGDMKRFLNVYSDADSTIFVTDKGVAKGKAQMEKNYLDGYAFKDEARRGDLATEVVDFRNVGSDHALTVVKFTLTPSETKTPPISGYSTLLFQKETGGWKVVADHSG
jgi:uncharacterized protein (TIGR02246 family)